MSTRGTAARDAAATFSNAASSSTLTTTVMTTKIPRIPREGQRRRGSSEAADSPLSAHSSANFGGSDSEIESGSGTSTLKWRKAKAQRHVKAAGVQFRGLSIRELKLITGWDSAGFALRAWDFPT